MNTKVCPHCSAEVPSVANLCKHCFHDFNVPVPKRKSPLFPVLLLLAGMAIVSGLSFGYIRGQVQSSNITVDEETKSIVFTTKKASGVTADRVYFKDVAQIEYAKNTQPRPFEIAIVASNGKRYPFKQSGEPLEFEANQLAEKLGKPLSIKDSYEAPAVIQK